MWNSVRPINYASEEEEVVVVDEEEEEEEGGVQEAWRGGSWRGGEEGSLMIRIFQEELKKIRAEGKKHLIITCVCA